MIGAAAAFYDSLAERYHLRGLGPDGSLADLRAELAEILREAGFRDVDWLMPETSGCYQLVVTARRGSTDVGPGSRSRLTVITYNTFQEKNGWDPALVNLLQKKEIMDCLQEVKPTRALGLKRSLGSRAFVSPAKYGLLYLALVLPESARFLEHRTASLNDYGGVLPKSWSLRRSYELHEAGRLAWRDGLEPRVAQLTRVLWEEREFRAVNTHLPFDSGLRNRCLDLLPWFLDSESALVTGDFNTTTQNLFLRDFLLTTDLRPAGTGEPTHDTGRGIDFVLCRGGFCEVGYEVTKNLSDHRLVRVELEVRGVAEFSHLDRGGAARMVDVGEKAVVRRTATAAGRVRMAPATVELLREKALPKGDALNTARIAGVMAAKRTPDLIPLCHGIDLTAVDVEFEVGKEEIDILATTRASDRTGVEMEALTAVSVAALTIYDMCKAVDKGMEIGEIKLLEKTKEPGGA